MFANGYRESIDENKLNEWLEIEYPTSVYLKDGSYFFRDKKNNTYWLHIIDNVPFYDWYINKGGIESDYYVAQGNFDKKDLTTYERKKKAENYLRKIVAYIMNSDGYFPNATDKYGDIELTKVIKMDESLNEDLNTDNYEIVKSFMIDIFNSDEDLACDDPDVMDDYDVDNPKDYARENHQYYADNLDEFFNLLDDGLFDDYEDAEAINNIDREELKTLLLKYFKEFGYLKESLNEDFYADDFNNAAEAMYCAQELVYKLVGDDIMKDVKKLEKWGEKNLDNIENLALSDLLADVLTAANYHEEAEDYVVNKIDISLAHAISDNSKTKIDNMINSCTTRAKQLNLLFAAINSLSLEGYIDESLADRLVI